MSIALVVSDAASCFPPLGTSVMSENTIIDLPTGVVTFYMDVHEPRTPGGYHFCQPLLNIQVHSPLHT